MKCWKIEQMLPKLMKMVENEMEGMLVGGYSWFMVEGLIFLALAELGFKSNNRCLI